MNTTRRVKLYNRKDTIYPIQKGGKYGKTMQELKNWYTHLFEKLGWMAISDDSEKVENYKQSIDKFIKDAESAKSKYADHNRKLDLEIMCMNAEELKKFVEKSL